MPSPNYTEFFRNKTAVAVAVLVLIGLAFWLGRSNGYTKGYAQAQADVQALQEEGARKAAEEAAKATNPFQAVNPLEGVEANPFEKVKKVLNPFEAN
ncbi:hypothetical protein HY412_01770 [Candidatus Kaiserbacteria bacterium]|nr:hypothetical protein [Candidatus Kaiserbacteria bacterium]